jgi:hypothetical protein
MPYLSEMNVWIIMTLRCVQEFSQIALELTAWVIEDKSIRVVVCCCASIMPLL